MAAGLSGELHGLGATVTGGADGVAAGPGEAQPTTTSAIIATTRPIDIGLSLQLAMSGSGQLAVHGATVMRTVGLVSPRRPSLDGVEKTARKSAVAVRRNEAL